MTGNVLNSDYSSIKEVDILGKKRIKIYPYCAIQALDSSYRIVRLNVVSKRFEVLPSIFTILDDCKDEVEALNEDSGAIEFILEDEV